MYSYNFFSLRHGKDYVAVEISGSFIVLGTKKMFDTGYENYLPIERIITHPEYKGWTADLALVFTFAGMTTDKPGNVIPLVEESESTPVDSNVTILSWGNCCENENVSSVGRLFIRLRYSVTEQLYDKILKFKKKIG